MKDKKFYWNESRDKNKSKLINVTPKSTLTEKKKGFLFGIL